MDGITDLIHMSLSKLQEIMKDREVLQFMGSQRVRHDLATELQYWRKSVENGSVNLVFFSFLKKDVWFLESGLCRVAQV